MRDPLTVEDERQFHHAVDRYLGDIVRLVRGARAGTKEARAGLLARFGCVLIDPAPRVPWSMNYSAVGAPVGTELEARNRGEAPLAWE